MTPERITSLIHEAWEKFTHAAYPDIAFYDSVEQAIITAINETKESDAGLCLYWHSGSSTNYADICANSILASKIKANPETTR